MCDVKEGIVRRTHIIFVVVQLKLFDKMQRLSIVSTDMEQRVLIMLGVGCAQQQYRVHGEKDRLAQVSHRIQSLINLEKGQSVTQRRRLWRMGGFDCLISEGGPVAAGGNGKSTRLHRQEGEAYYW